MIAFILATIALALIAVAVRAWLDYRKMPPERRKDWQ